MSFGADWDKMYHEPKNKPSFSSAFGLLTHLDVDELRGYLNDEDKFENMIKDVKEVSLLFNNKYIF